MKILIIANSKVVFGNELKSELTYKKLDVSLLDFEILNLYDNDNNENIKYSGLFKKYKTISKLHMFFRMMYIKKVIQENNFDIINIHTSKWFYLIILPWLIKQKFIITFYGSDFYRTSSYVKNIQKILYKNAKAITFTNPMTKQSFLDYYDTYQDKCYVCRFGLKTLDFIDKNIDKNRVNIKNFLGYKQDKIIVTCGYNSSVGQQHKKIIEAICALPKVMKNKLQFIFPLTYGDNINKEVVKNNLISTDIDYIVLEDFLYEDNNAFIKIVSDVMINVLETDSFSGSMQEFLYAKNIVITGAWLPYNLFDRAGVVYHKIEHTNVLTIKLQEVIENIDTYKEGLDVNRKIIYKLSGWKNNIKSWQEVYEN